MCTIFFTIFALCFSYSEEGRVCNNSVFHINGLMRIKILPDSSKMVVCTTGGYILLINNLDLDTLGTDIQGFKVIFDFLILTIPNMEDLCFTQCPYLIYDTITIRNMQTN